jgi:hypothetical protein
MNDDGGAKGKEGGVVEWAHRKQGHLCANPPRGGFAADPSWGEAALINWLTKKIGGGFGEEGGKRRK